MSERAIVFFDIDGTLCRYAEPPPPSVYTAFENLHKNGHIAFLCTGRGQCDIPQNVLKLGFDGIISGMGADIWMNGRLSEHAFLRPQDVLDSARVLDEHGVAAMYIGQTDLFRNVYMDPVERETGVCRCAADFSQKGYFPKFATIDIEYDDRAEFMEYCAPVLEKHSRVIEYTDGTCQTELRGAGKRRAVKKVLELPEYRGLRTFAAGDSQNDLDMLEIVDVGICMGGAPRQVKAIADYVTDTLENDGLAKALYALEIA